MNVELGGVEREGTGCLEDPGGIAGPRAQRGNGADEQAMRDDNEAAVIASEALGGLDRADGPVTEGGKALAAW